MSLITWHRNLTAAKRIKNRSLLLFGHEGYGNAPRYTDIGQWQTHSKSFELDRAASDECAIPFIVEAWAEVPVPSALPPWVKPAPSRRPAEIAQEIVDRFSWLSNSMYRGRWVGQQFLVALAIEAAIIKDRYDEKNNQ